MVRIIFRMACDAVSRIMGAHSVVRRECAGVRFDGMSSESSTIAQPIAMTTPTTAMIH